MSDNITDGHNEYGPIEKLVLKHARHAFSSQEAIDAQWRKLNYTSAPDYDRASGEYDRFADILLRHAEQVHFLPTDERVGLDSVYVRDTALITGRGAILCNMGKEARRGEPEVVGENLEALGIPVLGCITGDGFIEGGDVVWFDERTVAVGLGYRTNGAGILQLRDLTASFADPPVVVPLPHWNGPGDVFHLMSIISPLDKDLAAVYSRLMPVTFRDWLLERGIELVEIPDDEYESMACNILALGPRKCLALSGNPKTHGLLEKAGVEVITYDGDEISRKGAGGPTCLTRPLLRRAE